MSQKEEKLGDQLNKSWAVHWKDHRIFYTEVCFNTLKTIDHSSFFQIKRNLKFSEKTWVKKLSEKEKKGIHLNLPKSLWTTNSQNLLESNWEETMRFHQCRRTKKILGRKNFPFKRAALNGLEKGNKMWRRRRGKNYKRTEKSSKWQNSSS